MRSDAEAGLKVERIKAIMQGCSLDWRIMHPVGLSHIRTKGEDPHGGTSFTTTMVHTTNALTGGCHLCNPMLLLPLWSLSSSLSPTLSALTVVGSLHLVVPFYSSTSFSVHTYVAFTLFAFCGLLGIWRKRLLLFILFRVYLDFEEK